MDVRQVRGTEVLSQRLFRLRYPADWRSLLFLTALTFCFVAGWTGFLQSWILWLASSVLTIIACNVKHNHMHCRTFNSPTLNLLFNYWLGFCTGTTATEILTEHNERHHGHINEEIDYVRTTLVNFRSQLLNVLFFFPKAYLHLKLTKPSDLARWRKSHRRLYWQSLSEKIVLYSGLLALLMADWKSTLIFILLPWMNGQWWLLTFGLFQHQDMQGDSKFGNSRNITSFWFNWFYLNIGYHTAHHLRPGVHWSLLPVLHEKEIAPHLDPALDEKSLFSFYRNWFAGTHRCRNWAEQKPSPATDSKIDYTKKFIPEFITPLFYTTIYQELSEDQKLRYNQLYASNFHEQFMSLEKVLVEHLLQPLITRFQNEPLAQHLVEFREEEIKHTALFHDLHRRCEPRLYDERYFYFLRIPGPLRWALKQVSKRPALFPFCVWLTMIEEERTIFYSKLYLKEADRLEENFVATHRLHLADEVGHVRRDKELLERLWPDRSPFWRSINAWLFSWVLREFFNVPKRAGWRVVEELIREFPSLRAQRKRFRAELRSLEKDEVYLQTLYSREMVPNTFALLDQWPEFRFLQRLLPGYRAA